MSTKRGFIPESIDDTIIEWDGNPITEITQEDWASASDDRFLCMNEDCEWTTNFYSSSPMNVSVKLKRADATTYIIQSEVWGGPRPIRRPR